MYHAFFIVFFRVRDAYCRGCFLAAVHHTFRATLGKWLLFATGIIGTISRSDKNGERPQRMAKDKCIV
jgi:hypothetical protein